MKTTGWPSAGWGTMGLAVAALIAAHSMAQARPDTRAMSCASVNALVVEEGAIVLTTGQHTFKRFVSRRNFCDPWEWTRAFVVPSADQARCTVRSVCYDPPVPHNQ